MYALGNIEDDLNVIAGTSYGLSGLSGRTFYDAMQTILDGGIIHDIGQFDKKNKLLLNRAAAQGAISKGKGGHYPALTTVYAPIGFNFIKHRSAVIQLVKDAESGKISKMDYIKHRFDYNKFID